MLTAKSQYAHFERLEKMIKLGLACYLIIFCAGVAAAAIGEAAVFAQFSSMRPILFWVIGGAFIGGWFGVYRTLNAAKEFGDIHMWLDQRFFGFLRKSNEIIFGEIILALAPDERKSAVGMNPAEQGTLAKSIFSKLAGDSLVFTMLMRSGIFRSWIWYWILIYGTFTFSLLTAVSFVALVTGSDLHAKLLFSVNWLCALSHLALCVSMGFHLLRMTRRTVDQIVTSHRDEIAALLRANMIQTAV